MPRLQLLVIAALTLAGCGRAPSMPMAQAPGGFDASGKKAAKAPTGALPMENFTKVNETLFRGGLPKDEDLVGLTKLGVKLDIDLQQNRGQEAPVVAHEKAAAAKAGLGFLNLPIPYDGGPTDAMLKQYFDAFDQAKGGIYVHCLHGRDRTGMMIALYRIQRDHYSNEKAITEWKSFGSDPKKYAEYFAFVQAYKAKALEGNQEIAFAW